MVTGLLDLGHTKCSSTNALRAGRTLSRAEMFNWPSCEGFPEQGVIECQNLVPILRKPCQSLASIGASNTWIPHFVSQRVYYYYYPPLQLSNGLQKTAN